MSAPPIAAAGVPRNGLRIFRFAAAEGREALTNEDRTDDTDEPFFAVELVPLALQA
jgi:hypothetical protein